LRVLALTSGQLEETAEWMRAEDTIIERYQMKGFALSQEMARGDVALRRGDPRVAISHLDRVLTNLHPSQHHYRHTSEVQRALALAQSGDVPGAARAAMTATETFDRWRASLSDSSLRLLTVQAQRGQGWHTASLIARLADGGELPVAFALTERRRARDLRDRLLLLSAWRDDVAPPNVLRRETESPSAGEVQRALPDASTAVVTLDLGEAGVRGTAIVITRGGLSAYPLPSSDEVAPRVRRFVALLEAGRDATVEARALGSALIAPLLPRLDSAGVSRLVLLPEGVLHRVPFDALQLPDGRAVLQRFETSVAPSAAVLLRLQARAPMARAAPRVLALADADAPTVTDRDLSFGARLLGAVFGEPRAWPRLPGARDEVALVRRALPRTTVQVGGRAREAEVKRAAGAYDVLHFATHAVVDEWSGASAALALTAGDGDDGMLDSGEITALRLPAALVVLSACRTIGGTVVAGEGVRGLTSAFLEAGARSVVATSWRVDDRAVAPLVGAFYDALARGEPVGTALRSARLAAQRRGDSVSVWGAFTLVGDPWQRLVPAAR